VSHPPEGKARSDKLQTLWIPVVSNHRQAALCRYTPQHPLPGVQMPDDADHSSCHTVHKASWGCNLRDSRSPSGCGGDESRKPDTSVCGIKRERKEGPGPTVLLPYGVLRHTSSIPSYLGSLTGQWEILSDSPICIKALGEAFTSGVKKQLLILDRIVSGFNNKIVRVWDPEMGEQLRELQGRSWSHLWFR
jgi:hypothetical protein